MAQAPTQTANPEIVTDAGLLERAEIVINDDNVVSFQATRTADGKWSFVVTVKAGACIPNGVALPPRRDPL